ncbi:MAG: hypothetical protein JXX14_06560 [Deltaproteobacteria bacterium]|nr:hypothetical protein [Deltaproteobacteria bacterium]
MIDRRWTAKDELIDILLDLKHDLGKYLFLHLSHLTADSPVEATLEALRVALLETRVVGGKPQSAAEIWQRYRQEIDALNYSFNGRERLNRVIEDALAMHTFIQNDNASRPPHAREVQQIARRLSETISEIIEAENSEEYDG